MSTKAQQRKQAKVKARQKAVKHRLENNRREMAETLSRRQDAALMRSVAQQGVVKTALSYKELKHRASNGNGELTNFQVIQGINDVIPIITLIHGGVQVLETLASEKKITLTPEQDEVIATFDEKVVKVTEDVNGIILFVQANKQPEDYMDLFVHYIDIVAEMMEEHIPLIREQLLIPNELLINEYVAEHKLENEDDIRFGLRMHNDRMLIVAPIYRTKAEAFEFFAGDVGLDAELSHPETIDQDTAFEPVESLIEEGELIELEKLQEEPIPAQ